MEKQDKLQAIHGHSQLSTVHKEQLYSTPTLWGSKVKTQVKSKVPRCKPSLFLPLANIMAVIYLLYLLTYNKGPHNLQPHLYGKIPTCPHIRGSCRTAWSKPKVKGPSSVQEQVICDSSDLMFDLHGQMNFPEGPKATQDPSSLTYDLTYTTWSYETYGKATSVAQEGINDSLTGNGGIYPAYTPTSRSITRVKRDSGVTEGLNDGYTPTNGSIPAYTPTSWSIHAPNVRTS